MKKLFLAAVLSLFTTTILTHADITENDVITSESSSLESRQGWLATIGLGLHQTSFNILRTTQDPKNKVSIATSFKLGYNFTEQLAIHYVRNASWYKQFNDTYITGISGIGATYYLLPKQETLYVGFAIGVGDYTNLSEVELLTGTAFMATIGYEFSPHWQAEVSWMRTSVDDRFNDTLKTSSFQLLINYSWY